MEVSKAVLHLITNVVRDRGGEKHKDRQRRRRTDEHKVTDIKEAGRVSLHNACNTVSSG